MSLREMSETKPKRDSEYEGSNIKRMRLDDDDDVLRSPTRTLSSSSSSSLAYSVSDSGGFCSVALSEEEDDHRSSSISSGCSSSETNEIATRLPFSDLEVKFRNSRLQILKFLCFTINAL